jgi:hypothetical protein
VIPHGGREILGAIELCWIARFNGEKEMNSKPRRKGEGTEERWRVTDCGGLAMKIFR